MSGFLECFAPMDRKSLADCCNVSHKGCMRAAQPAKQFGPDQALAPAFLILIVVSRSNPSRYLSNSAPTGCWAISV